MGDDGQCDTIRAPIVACLNRSTATHVDHPHLHRHRHGLGLGGQPADTPRKYPTDWGVLFIIGVTGSLIAGVIVNLVMGDGSR